MEEQKFFVGNEAPPKESSFGFSLTDFLHLLLKNWYWFLISITICLAAATFYIKKTPKTYVRTATILVKDTRKGGNSDLMAFSDVAGVNTRKSVDNELIILKSNKLRHDVARRLRLDINYSDKVGLRPRNLYGISPVAMSIVNDNETDSFAFTLTIGADSTVSLTDFVGMGVNETAATSTIKAHLRDTISTPIGSIIINPTLYYNKNEIGHVIHVSKSSIAAAASLASVNVALADKNSSIIAISKMDSNPRRAEDVINMLITCYEDDAKTDKKRISEATAEFISDRLALISSELGDVDEDVASFKQSHQMVSLESEAARNMSESDRFRMEGLQLENQIRMSNFIKDYLLDPTHTNDLIPAAVAVSDAATNANIANYNETLIRRDKLLANSSTSNPMIQEIDSQLSAIRRSIIASIDNQIATLNIQLDNIRTQQNRAASRVSAIPRQEKQIQSITRQQKIKEELYLYLLNKREENEIALNVVEGNARIIDPAYGSGAPVAPQISTILLAALLLGLAIPMVILYVIEILNTTIRGRKDLEDNLSIPFLGEVPLHKGAMDRGIVVRDHSTDPVSEAMRIIRSNMAFMKAQSSNLQTIMITSSNPHAGKTFISSNLAMSLALTNKRVILIDFDLRRRTLSKEFGQRHNRKGLSSYLAGTFTELNDIIFNSDMNANLDIIYAGPQPPNPAEMLMSEKLDKMMEELKTRYDYVIIDAVPSMMIADAQIINRLAELTIYVVREGLLDRRQLPDIERLYTSGKFNNMSIILNGASSNNGYGYRHGYGYQYGYGYGHSDSKSKKKSVLNRLKKK
jgi:capsular exopolysaccharide synthesis family protein